MSFVAINEQDNFIYRDSYITNAHFEEAYIEFLSEALIVKACNSQNSNFTDSYADVTKIEFHNSQIVSLVKVGLKKYDANDRLIEVIPDSEVDISNVNLKELFEKAFLLEVKKLDSGELLIAIELPDIEIGAVTDEYEMTITCDKTIYSWDKYLNRVQSM